MDWKKYLGLVAPVVTVVAPLVLPDVQHAVASNPTASLAIMAALQVLHLVAPSPLHLEANGGAK